MLGRRRFWVCVWAAYALSARGGVAWAQREAPTEGVEPRRGASASEFTLRVRAPLDCAARVAIEEALNRLVPVAGRPAVQVEVSLEPGHAQWSARVLLRGAQRGFRQLHAPDCESAAKASALIIALALDPNVAAVAPEPSFEAPPMELPSDAPSTERVAGAETTWRIQLGGELVSAPLPVVAVGVSGEISLDQPAWQVSLGAFFVPRVQVPLDAVSAGSFQLLRWKAEGCLTLFTLGAAAGHYRVSGCAGALGNVLSGDGRGAVVNTPQTSYVYSALGTARLVTHPTAWLTPTLDLGAELPLQRPRFAIENAGDLYRVRAVGLLAQLGLSLRVF